VRWHLTLREVVALAWAFVVLALLLGLCSGTDDTQLPIQFTFALSMWAGLVAFPIAAGGSLVLLLRQLSHPGDEYAADYDDKVAAAEAIPPDRAPPL